MSLKHRAVRLAGLGIGGLLVSLTWGCGTRESGDREPDDESPAALVEFSRRIDEYVALRNRLAEKVGPIDETKSQAEIAARAATLAHLITTERANAKQGDLFTPEVATHLTALIARENSGRTPAVQETREDAEEEHRSDGLADFAPQVNMAWPTTHPLPTFPPRLLPLLPKLPPEVEYRVMAHALILREIEANLIIDFLPNAVP